MKNGNKVKLKTKIMLTWLQSLWFETFITITYLTSKNQMNPFSCWKDILLVTLITYTFGNDV